MQIDIVLWKKLRVPECGPDGTSAAHLDASSRCYVAPDDRRGPFCPHLMPALMSAGSLSGFPLECEGVCERRTLSYAGPAGARLARRRSGV